MIYDMAVIGKILMGRTRSTEADWDFDSLMRLSLHETTMSFARGLAICDISR